MEEPETYNAKGIGERLGRVMIARASKYFEAPAGKEPVFQEKEETETIERASAEERATYNKYLGIVIWLSSTRGQAKIEQEKAKQAAAVISRLTNEAITGETFSRYVDRQPAIMAGIDFVKTQDAGKEAYFSKDGKDVSLTAYDIFLEALFYAMATLERYPTAANPLRAIEEAYKKEPIKSRYILDNWNTVNSIGYYTLASGKKGPLMTRAEFERFLDGEQAALFSDIIDNYLGGGPADFEERLKADKDGIYGIKWSAATARPRGLTKWQALYVLDNLYGKATDYTDLVEEFKEAVAALSKQLLTDYKIDLQAIPVEKWGEPYITRRKLYKMDFCIERRKADNYYREKEKNGVAVIQGVASAEPGYYAKPREVIYKEQTLEGYIPGQWDTRVERITQAKEGLLDSYYFIKGYNWAIEQIAETQGAPGFLNCLIDTKGIGGAINAINCNVELLYSVITGLPSDEKLKTKKLEAIKNYFLIPRLNLLRAPAENIRKAARLIKSLEAFKKENFTALYPLILNRPKEGPADGQAAGEK